jgi:DHA3 family macrolide efflux protein-like MFS transporter
MQTTAELSSIPKNWARRFFIIWTGQAFSLVGSALVQFALIWYLTKTTGSATVLAVASLIGILPMVFLAPFAGTWIDRWNRRITMIAADSIIAFATLVLMFLFATGLVQVWHVYAILLIRAAGGAFHYPSMSSSTSLMVPKEHLARIAGMNQTLQGIISIVSPPLGALLLALLPMQWVLSVDIITAALAVGPLLFLAIPQPPRQIAQAAGLIKKTSYWQDMKEGFTYIAHWPGLLGIIIIAMMVNFLLSPVSALMPLMIMKIFHGGPLQLGWSESVFGVGMIAGGLVLSAWGGFKQRIITTLSGIIGIGIGVTLAGLTPGNLFPIFLVGYFVLGFTQVFANGPLSAIFQANIEPDMQGRVLTLVSAGATAMMPLSLMIAGPVSDWLGIRVWFMIGGIASILMAIIAFMIKPIREIESNRRVSEVAPATSQPADQPAAPIK